MRLLRLSSSVISMPGCTVLRTMPGKPAPVPTSMTFLSSKSQTFKSAAQSRKCSRATSSVPLMAVRFMTRFRSSRYSKYVLSLSTALASGVMPSEAKPSFKILSIKAPQKMSRVTARLILAYSFLFINQQKKLWSPIWPSHVVSIIPLPQYRPTWKNSASPTVL